MSARRRVPRPRPGDPLEAFSPQEVATCLAYAKPRQRWAMAAFAAELALLAALALSPPGWALLRWTVGLAGHVVAGQAALAVALAVLLQALLSLPFSLRNWRQDVRAGLATQRLGGFLGDWAKSHAVGLALTVVPVGGLIVAARWQPPGWPWVAGAAAALLVVTLSLLGPVLLEPLFNRFRPLDAGPLRERVLDLAASMGIGVREVLVADASRRTTKVNAYVSGLGRTRRVVVYDTLLARAPASAGTRTEGVPAGGARDDQAGRAARENEIVLVLAHELAHVRHRDVLWGTAAGALGAFAGVVAANWLLAAALAARQRPRRPQGRRRAAAARRPCRAARQPGRQRGQPLRRSPRRLDRPGGHPRPGDRRGGGAPPRPGEPRRSAPQPVAGGLVRQPPAGHGPHRPSAPLGGHPRQPRSRQPAVTPRSPPAGAPRQPL